MRSEHSRRNFNFSQMSLRSESDSSKKIQSEQFGFAGTMQIKQKLNVSRSKSRGRNNNFNCMPLNSPSIQTAKCMLERANNLLATTRTRLGQLKENKENLNISKSIVVSPAKTDPEIMPNNKRTNSTEKPQKIMTYAPVYHLKGNKKTITNMLPDNNLSIASFDLKSDDQNSTPVTENPVFKITLKGVIQALDLCDLEKIFEETHLSKLEDFLLLTKDDMREMNIPIYARNRIVAFQTYFKNQGKDIKITQGLFYNILKEIYNPSLIDLIKDAENKEIILTEPNNQKLSIIEQTESPSKSPNEDKTLQKLASDLKGTSEISISPEISKMSINNQKSQTPSFSAHQELKFGKNAFTEYNTLRNPVLSELKNANNCDNLQEEMRDFNREYNKAQDKFGTVKTAKISGVIKTIGKDNKLTFMKENKINYENKGGYQKVSEKHKEQLEKYRQELESILGLNKK